MAGLLHTLGVPRCMARICTIRSYHSMYTHLTWTPRHLVPLEVGYVGLRSTAALMSNCNSVLLLMAVVVPKMCVYGVRCRGTVRTAAWSTVVRSTRGWPFSLSCITSFLQNIRRGKTFGFTKSRVTSGRGKSMTLAVCTHSLQLRRGR